MASYENGQSCLEKRGMEQREKELVRSDYNINNQYGPTHPDAISDGDVAGKGTGGNHSHYLPDCTKPTGMIDYSNFTTDRGGGYYDIYGRAEAGESGREVSLARSMYNRENPYGAELVNTEKNIADGQYYVGMTTKHM